MTSCTTERGYLARLRRFHRTITDQVDALRLEHGLLYEELRDLRLSVDDPKMFQTHSARILSATDDWMDRVRTHEREERRLEQIASNLAVGVGD